MASVDCFRKTRNRSLIAAVFNSLWTRSYEQLAGSIDLSSMRQRLQHLIDDASVVVLSIQYFKSDGNYGRVEDHDLDRQRLITFELEVESIFKALATHSDPVFRHLLEKSAAWEEEA